MSAQVSTSSQIGFIKRPNVSEIHSTSPSDQALTLGCEITDFHPPNISVTWLRLREGEQDDREEEGIEGGELWGPIQTQPRLYRATASLKRRLTNQEKKERGGIICRVEHCSLLEPIERRWRNVDIGMDHSQKWLWYGGFSFHSFTIFCVFPLSCSLHSSIHLSLLEQRRGRCVLAAVQGRSPKGQIALGSGRTHSLAAGIQRDRGDRRRRTEGAEKCVCPGEVDKPAKSDKQTARETEEWTRNKYLFLRYISIYKCSMSCLEERQRLQTTFGTEPKHDSVCLF